MTSTAALRPRGLAAVAAGLLSAVAVVAGGVALTAAPAVAHVLGFGFAGVPRNVSTAGAILVNNLRMSVGIALAAGVVRIARQADGSSAIAPLGNVLSAGLRALAAVCDAGVAAAVMFNAAIVGAAYGAYGWRMVHSTLPHGPLELAAYAVVLNLYRLARRGPVPARAWALALATVTGLLAVAAALETYVAPL